MPQNPIIVAGMHRSGTSVVTRLLNLCGLYLGPEDHLIGAEEDNPAGFWEHSGFHRINNALLAVFGGGWDLPPALPKNWSDDRRLADLRREAQALIQSFDGRPNWGWKDPRNSLTLPFWRSLLPDARILVPLRNPLDIAASLDRRAHSSPQFALYIWTYYMRALAPVLEEAPTVVTHFSAFFLNPEAELNRVANCLGLSPSLDQIRGALRSLNPALRHSSCTYTDLFVSDAGVETVRLYRDASLRAGPVWAERFGKEEAELERLGVEAPYRVKFARLQGTRLPSDNAVAKAMRVLEREGTQGLKNAIKRKLTRG